jgi:hypothetical protein
MPAFAEPLTLAPAMAHTPLRGGGGEVVAHALPTLRHYHCIQHCVSAALHQVLGEEAPPAFGMAQQRQRDAGIRGCVCVWGGGV